MDKNAQSQNIEFREEDLYGRGWRISEAARECGVTHQHLSQVLRGKRKSARLLDKVRLLPKKALSKRDLTNVQ